MQDDHNWGVGKNVSCEVFVETGTVIVIVRGAAAVVVVASGKHAEMGPKRAIGRRTGGAPAVMGIAAPVGASCRCSTGMAARVVGIERAV